MLSTLHDTLHDRHVGLFHWRHTAPIFRFFMIHQDGRIRFFFQVEKKHRTFLESQLYAHYSDIEIRESDLPIQDDQEFQIQEARLAHIDSDTLKLYVSMKDRTEKESIDPISSLTSALSKCCRGDTAFIRVDFAPLPDHAWRE
jgi:hypothetical protein